MKVTVKQITPWSLALDSARWTVNKEQTGKEPSEGFRREMVMSEHSPIREVRYHVEMRGIPNASSQQISRHDNFMGHSHRTGTTDQNFVGTSRPDLTDKKPEEVTRLTPIDHKISLSAADFIELSKKRLCHGKVSKETYWVWRHVINELAYVDPILARFCVPTCIYRGFCPEKNSCGYADTAAFEICLNDYRNTINRGKRKRNETK